MSAGEDPLGDLAARVERLEATPLEDRPGVLEALHRELVAELEGLAAGGGPAG